VEGSYHFQLGHRKSDINFEFNEVGFHSAKLEMIGPLHNPRIQGFRFFFVNYLHRIIDTGAGIKELQGFLGHEKPSYDGRVYSQQRRTHEESF